MFEIKYGSYDEHAHKWVTIVELHASVAGAKIRAKAMKWALLEYKKLGGAKK